MRSAPTAIAGIVSSPAWRGTAQYEAGDYAGACWLLLGPAAAGGSLSAADAVRTGASAAENAGASLAAPGDIDGDGLADLVVGSPWGDGGASNSGVTWILYGPVQHRQRAARQVLAQLAGQHDRIPASRLVKGPAQHPHGARA